MFGRNVTFRKIEKISEMINSDTRLYLCIYSINQLVDSRLIKILLFHICGFFETSYDDQILLFERNNVLKT